MTYSYLNDAWANASGELGDWLPPDGDHQGIVEAFDFLTSQKNGRDYLKTVFTLTGEFQGRQVSTLHEISEERIDMLKRHLLALEVAPENLDDLSGALRTALDVPVRLRVKTAAKLRDDGTPYRNLYVEQRLGDPIRPTTTRAAPPVAAAGYARTDDLPF